MTTWIAVGVWCLAAVGLSIWIRHREKHWKQCLRAIHSRQEPVEEEA